MATVEDVEYVRKVSSGEREVVMSSDGDWYFEEGLEDYHDHSVNSYNPTEDTNEVRRNSTHRVTRTPIAIAGLNHLLLL